MTLRDTLLRVAVASKRFLASTPLRGLATTRPAEALREWLVRRRLEGTEWITVGGLSLEVPASFAAHNADGFEPLSMRWLCDTARPGQLVFDVGAHVGVVSCVVGGAVGSAGAVVAIEPDPRSHPLLRANLARTGLGSTVTVVEAAAGASTGTSTLVQPANTDAAHLSGRRTARGSVVEVVTLDQLADRFGFPDLVKIDVEGWEPDVLDGMEQVLRRRPRLLLELNPARLEAVGHRPEVLVTRLRTLGYSLTVIDDVFGRTLSADEFLSELSGLPSRWYANLACDA